MQSTNRSPRVVCAGCGCLCDDIGLLLDGPRIAAATNACEAGQTWLLTPRELALRCWIEGREASLAAAAHRAAELLDAAAAPAFQGLVGLSNEALRETVLLAALVPAWLVPWPLPSLAAERCGCDAPEFTASLGAVRGTADLVIYWQADPQATHPRHIERFSQGERLRGDNPRRLLLVDSAAILSQNRTASSVGQTIPLPESGDTTQTAATVIRGVHLLLRANEASSRVEGLPSAAVALADALRQAEHTHVFLGDSAAEDALLASSWHALAAEVRPRHHVTVSALPRAGNDRGVAEVLTAFCGNPGAVDFSFADGRSATARAASAAAWYPTLPTGGASTNPTGADLLALVGCSTPGRVLAQDLWRRMPRIVIDTCADPTADVAFQIPGFDPRVQATITRGDGVPLTLCGTGTAGPGDPAVTVLCALRDALVAHRGQLSPTASDIE